jgi:DNA-binding NtrC family response regulator
MLSGEDRAFFTRVSEAAFANPFGEARAELDRSLAQDAASRRSKSFADALRAVEQRLAGLGPFDLARLEGADRRLLEDAALFDVFHRAVDRLDALIDMQRAAGDRSVRVPFAGEVQQSLEARGFAAREASRYFALFYQLRRAYLFIDESLPGTSTAMRRFREHLWQNLFTHDPRLYGRTLWRRMEDFSTFLVGETGTGKGTAAAAIGRAAFIPFDDKTETFAASFEKGFVSINLSQFPETLLESELFGHTRGAFTGAATAHDGVFSRCSAHGAIFLDEIGEASAPVQVKLLRVLQERTFSPVGGHEVLRFKGRVVAATNRSLPELRERSLRDDFYYRLCSDVILVPPLRERLAEDPRELGALVRVILGRILGDGSEAGAQEGLTRLVTEAIERDLGAGYAWPGNVRELEQCVRRVLLTGRYEGDTRAPRAGLTDVGLLDIVGDETARGLTIRYCQALYARHGSYEDVARRTGLDRRTVKAHVLARTP